MHSVAVKKPPKQAFSQKRTGTDATKTVNSGLGTGLYYYGARYLDPKTSRWISADPAMGEYIPVAPINDEAKKHNQNLPGMGGIFNLVNLHTYHYAGNNPIKLVDPDGRTSEEGTVKKLQANTQNIMDAAAEFGVDPVIIAACAYAEQRLNFNIIDILTDYPAYLFDTSIGIGQVRISTAKMLEDTGLMPKTERLSNRTDGMSMSREERIAIKLHDDRQNIRYVAAYLKYFQDEWKEAFSEIAERADILGTLYNRGHQTTNPHGSPRSNSFGDYVQENYEHVKSILGLE